MESLLIQMPSLETFNHTVDRLLQSLKYLKLHEFILNHIYKLLELVWKIIKRLFGENTNSNNSDLMTRAVVGLIIIIILIIIIVIVVLLLVHKKRKKKINTILGEKINKNSTVLSFLDRSKVLEEEGQYREAVRLHFIAVLFYLHQNHILYHDQSMTGLEMIDQLKKDGFKAIDPFEKMVREFNTSWYGIQELAEDGFKAWQANEGAFWQEVKK